MALAAPGLVAEILRRFGSVRVKADGTSMLPSIRPGDILVVRHVPADRIASGDVVLCARGERLFAHRVASVGGASEFTTRGDAHRQNDPPLAASAILGRVVAIERHGTVVPLPLKPRARTWAVAAGEARRIIGRFRMILAARLRQKPRAVDDREHHALRAAR